MPTVTAMCTAGINQDGRNAKTEHGPNTGLHNLQTVHDPQLKGDLPTWIAKVPQEIAVPPEPGTTSETAITAVEVPAAEAPAAVVRAVVEEGEEGVAEAEDDR
jgi:hypothetical protein